MANKKQISNERYARLLMHAGPPTFALGEGERFGMRRGQKG
jgi:hypothetical protein